MTQTSPEQERIPGYTSETVEMLGVRVNLLRAAEYNAKVAVPEAPEQPSNEIQGEGDASQ